MTDFYYSLTRTNWVLLALLSTITGMVFKERTRNDVALGTPVFHKSDNFYYYYYIPPVSPTRSPIVRRQGQSKCDGEENLKRDINIASFKLSLVATIASIFSLTEFSIPSNNISIITTVLALILWVPSATLTFFAVSGQFAYISGNLVNLGSVMVTLYGVVGIVFGTLDLIVSTVVNVLGTMSLILSGITTFDEVYDELKQVAQRIFGRERVNKFIQGYGCNNPLPSVPILGK